MSARRIAQWFAYSAPVILLGVFGWAHRWTTDDGFIYLRIVRELTSGHGPVFNSGQRVEAFTSPLWVAVLAIADAIAPIRLEWLAAGLGLGLSLAGVSLAIAGSARLCHRAGSEMLVPLGVLVLVALLPMWYWETAGLETGLVFAWLGLSLWLLARWAGAPHRHPSTIDAAALGLGWLVRPELIAVSAIFVVLVLAAQWRGDHWRDRVRFLVAATALPLLYELFRMGYYGVVVANTAIAKEGTEPRVHEGWLYLQDFTRPYCLWLPVSVLVLGAIVPLAVRLRRSDEERSAMVLGAFFVAALVSAGSVVGYGGDYFHGRLLLPALFMLCAPIAVIPATKRYLAGIVVVAWAAICMVALRPSEFTGSGGGGHNSFVLPQGVGGKVTLADTGWGPNGRWNRWFHGPALYIQTGALGARGTAQLKLRPAPGVRLPLAVQEGIGAPSFALPQLFVLDVHGLADPLTAHFELAQRGYPGHEKTLPAPWVAAIVAAPDADLRASQFPIKFSPSTPNSQTEPFLSQVRDARAALECPAIRDLRQSVTGALTLGKFFSNILHSFSRTELRIPSDPRTAYQKLCVQGTGTRARARAAHTPNVLAVATPTSCAIVEPLRVVPRQILCSATRTEGPKSDIPQRTTMSWSARAPPGGAMSVRATAAQLYGDLVDRQRRRTDRASVGM